MRDERLMVLKDNKSDAWIVDKATQMVLCVIVFIFGKREVTIQYDFALGPSRCHTRSHFMLPGLRSMANDEFVAITDEHYAMEEKIRALEKKRHAKTAV